MGMHPNCWKCNAIIPIASLPTHFRAHFRGFQRDALTVDYFFRHLPKQFSCGLYYNMREDFLVPYYMHVIMSIYMLIIG
jgi:hypothetical protein